ncbi:MAG: hypothetical protein NZZ41_04375 [Candidatus Dojkabacteria bacterium]|nr:hypothetical protein [Candidatus Dojkabacteria bacterium]
MKTRKDSYELLYKYIKSKSLLNHSYMVATGMEYYARLLSLSSEEIEEWWHAGLLHDLDWEMYPETHPLVAVNQILPDLGYSAAIINAIKAHAPERTNYMPTTNIEKFLFACDELSGFLYAVALVRPNKFSDMTVASVIKRLKEKSFASNINRLDIQKGADLIGITLEEHIQNLITCFQLQQLQQV